MITKFMTEITTRFNPFSPNSRSARLFLALLPPNARQTMVAKTKILPRSSTEPSYLKVKFKDGKEMEVDCDRLAITGVTETVDRHSRKLLKEEALTE